MTNPPHFKGFKPIGLTEEEIPIVFNYEEYEAIRLSDFEFLGQMEASLIMGISRSTYARIYESARRKVAQAFILGKAILFEGGKVYFDSEWYSCNNCGCWFNHAAKEQEIRNCTLCGSTDIEQYKENLQQCRLEDICMCPICGKEKVHSLGTPCQDEVCPACNCPMIRNGGPHQPRIRKRNCN